MAINTRIFSHKSVVLIVGVLWAGIYFLALGRTAFTDPNEGYYAEAAREMVESGDWIVPHLNYQIYFSKPILNFWFIAIPYKLFGENEFSARIVFSLLCLLLLVGVMLFTRRLAGTVAGIMAATICATAPLMMAASRISPIDIALTCFLSLAIFAWILDCIFRDRRFWPYFYSFMALAVLTKGPAILLFVLISMTVFLAIDFLISKKNSNQSVVETFIQEPVYKHLICGCLLFLVITLPWYIAVAIATKGLFLKVFFLYENLARFKGYTNFTGSYWYHYFPVLMYSFVPWILFLIPATKYIFTAYVNQKESNLENKLTNTQTIQALVYLFCYAGILFCILSRSGTQMDTYLLPAIPPLSVIIAYYLNQAALKMSFGKSNFPALNIISAILVTLGLSLLVTIVVFWTLPVPAVIKLPFSLIPTLLAIGCLIQYWFKIKKEVWSMLTTFFITIILVCTLTFHLVCYLVDQSGQRDLKNLCLLYKKSKDHLCVFHAFKPSILFYTQRPVDSFFHFEEVNLLPPVTNAGESSRRLLVFVSDQYLPLLKSISALRLKLLTERGNWQVMQIENADLSKQITLENMFRHTRVINDVLTKNANWGPLTVPYTSGNLKQKDP